MFTHACLDLAQGPVALLIPEWTDAVEPLRRFFYVVGCHAVYDNPIGLKGTSQAADNKAVNSVATGNKKHVVIFYSASSGYQMPAIDVLDMDDGAGGQVKVPVSTLQVPGNLAMLLFRILYPRGSAPEPPEKPYVAAPALAPQGYGRWASKHAMNDFQHSLILKPLHELLVDVGSTLELPPKVSQDLPQLLRTPAASTSSIALDFWDSVSRIAAYNNHSPSSPLLNPAWDALRQHHVHPTPRYPGGEIPHLGDRVSPPVWEALEQANEDAVFLLDFLLTKTSGIAARKDLGYWISSRTLNVQPPEMDANWGDLIKRAARASKGFGALFPADVTYFSSMSSSEGTTLVVDPGCESTVRFRVPLGKVPASQDGFWSCNLYRASDLSQIRSEWGIWACEGDYALRTDASDPAEEAELVLSAEPWMKVGKPCDLGDCVPRGWIPLPAGVSANIVLRCYNPLMQVIDGSWAPKGIIRESWDGQQWNAEEAPRRGWFGLW